MNLQDLLKQAHKIQEQLNTFKELQEILKRNKDAFSTDYSIRQKFNRDDLYHINRIISEYVEE